jgi:exopolyphosphatase/guanosine-5'-triphosphate,3'-diphosphate pyrophosphatase
MGCVSFTDRFFGDGRIDKKALRQAELAAREQVQTIAARYEKEGWKEAVGSSGMARSIAEVLQKGGRGNGTINAPGLAWLREELLKAGEVKKLSLPGLRDDRVPVVAGGVAIMCGIFDELELDEMRVATGALRDGVLWDLLGRVHHRDIREVTVEQFARRYHVDSVQAERVRALANRLKAGIAGENASPTASDEFLDWAARLHEIGISIAQGAYHKHSAYILANADMPGFSRQEQGWLSNLVLAQRGKLAKMGAAFDDDEHLATLAFCLRLAVIFYRSRRALQLPKLSVRSAGRGWRLKVPADWLERNSLVAVALAREQQEWKSVGFDFEVASE